jgi:Fibronectin type III domain
MSSGCPQGGDVKSLLLPHRIIGFLLLFFILFASETLRAEFVFLKTGEIIEGTVITDTPSIITIRDKDKKTTTYRKGEVLRIQFAKIYIGKVYVQKTDGTNITGYVVEENSDTYTLRSELNNPKEFVIKRDEVLFIARGNPSGLHNDGEIGTNKITFKWFQPYNPVRNYYIYLKSPTDTSFIKIDESSSTGLTVKNLKSNTRYTAKVTAIDNNGVESLPTNEYSFTTKNIKPFEPENISKLKSLSIDGKSLIVKLSWDGAADPDGTITGYSIYNLDGSEPRLIAKTKEQTFTITDLAPNRIYLYGVRSLDDKNDESADIIRISTRDSREIALEVRPYFIKPFGTLGELFNIGYGASATAYVDNVFFNNLDIGAAFGYWHLSPKLAGAQSSYMIPMLAAARYRIPVSKLISIVPALELGASYNHITYTAVRVTTSKGAVEPIAHASCDIQYRFRYTSATIGAGYFMIFENNKRLGALTCSAGLSVRL